MSDESPSAAPPVGDRPAWLSALETTVAGGELTGRYRLGLVLVAVAMLLLPLAYLALIALAGWLLYWHSTAHLESFGDSNLQFGLFYIAPLVFGAIGFVFMFKPLFARRPAEEAAVCLTPEQQPALFEFVARLCACLQAPTPQRIEVHVDPGSTGATFRRGFGGLLGHEMTLRISLPLVETLTLRELAGALAHELGHCRQGAAIRAWWLIGRVDTWFFSAVFLPDAWDRRLDMAARQMRSPLVRGLAMLAHAVVFLTRLLLLALMLAGRAISGSLLRQMELSADRSAMLVAGSDTLREWLLKGHTLIYAWNLVEQSLEAGWFDGRLADDLPALVISHAGELAGSDETVRQIEDAVFGATAGAFDRDAAPACRIAQAEQDPSSGLPLPSSAATELFSDFRGLCRAATRTYYEQVLGPEFDNIQLIDTEVMVGERAAQYEADRTLYRYFQGQLLGHVELFLPEGWLAPPADAEQTIRALRQARQGMHAELPKVGEALLAFEQAEAQRCQVFSAQLLQAARVRFRPADLGLESGDVAGISKPQEDGWQAREQAIAALEIFIRHAETRLAAGLCLLHDPQLAGQLAASEVSPAELLPRVARLGSVLGDLRAAWPGVQPLREHLFGLALLMHQAEQNARNQAYWIELQRVAAIVHELLGKLRGALVTTPYPFQHAEGEITVSQYLLDEVPPADQVGDLAQAAEELLTRLLALYFRAMAQLAVTAEQVEAALGLPRLPDPPGPEDQRSAATLPKNPGRGGRST